MVTKKIRTEYMKKFKDPRWETFSKCYEDSLKYRLTRRVMEHSHKPWFWDGWESGSESSGWSTPRLTRNRVVPLSLPPPPPPPEDRAGHAPSAAAAKQGNAAPTATAVLEPVVNEASAASATPSPNSDSATDDGPADTPPSSDAEPANPAPKRRQRRHRGPRSEPGAEGGSNDDKPAVARKPPRAKSQPAISSKEKENRRPAGRLDWTERHTDVKRSNNEQIVQPRRESEKRRGQHSERRRARSADLEKTRQQLTVAVDERWMTEYMRCFSARLR